MRRRIYTFALLLAMTGCGAIKEFPSTSLGEQPTKTPGTNIAAFATSAGRLSTHWAPLVIFRSKKQTKYRLISEKGEKVVHAYANEASSGLMQHVAIEMDEQPWLDWKWKIGHPVDTVDQQKQATEDSPARVILGFDGDKESLPFADQVLFDTAKLFTGHDFPYATLMYIWDRSTPIGTVMPSYRSGRIKMIVVANEESGVGTWQAFSRNVIEDFEAAFGERPGKLIGVGILTDTDNLGQTVEAWYGNLRLRPSVE